MTDLFFGNGFDFNQLNAELQSMGIYQFVLPFLLCFTIVFAILEKTKILGQESKKYNIVIAIVMGLLLIQLQDLVNMVNLALPDVSVMIVAIVMMFIIIAMFNGDKGIGGVFGSTALKVIAGLAAVFVLWAFWSSYTGEVLPNSDWVNWISDNLETIIVLGVFAAILGFITTGDKEPTSTTPPSRTGNTQTQQTPPPQEERQL